MARKGTAGRFEASQHGCGARVVGKDARQSRKIILTSAPLLTAVPSGDVLELRPGGSWIAVNAATLEKLSDAVAPQVDRSSTVKLDMAEVRELDTLGAWLLEKMSRRAI